MCFTNKIRNEKPVRGSTRAIRVANGARNSYWTVKQGRGNRNFRIASQLENMKILWNSRSLIYDRRNGRTSIIITKWLIFTSWVLLLSLLLLLPVVCLTFFLRKNIVDVRGDSISPIDNVFRVRTQDTFV